MSRREKLVPTAAALRRLIYQLDDIGLPVDPFWQHDGGLADRVRFTAPRDIVPLETYEDQPIERVLSDWRWMSMFFNRVNTAMSKNPLYPFEIPPAVADKLGFIHRGIRETARTAER